MTTVWIVEDHAPFRRSLMAVLAAEGDLACPRAFASCEELLAVLGPADHPDVLLLDVGLPGMSGLDGLRVVRERSPSTQVLILTSFEDDDKVFRAVCAGAGGYLLKTAAAADIVAAIREVLAGGSPMTPRIARRVLTMFTRFAPPRGDGGLSERESEILHLLVDGRSKKEIAGRLELSIHTVDTYLRRIYGKLEVNSRSSAVAKALRDGLV